jgi:hypothetical protein
MIHLIVNITLDSLLKMAMPKRIYVAQTDQSPLLISE